MKHPAKFIAVDLGASSGRMMAGQWDGRALTVEEFHRFPNGSVSNDGGLYWDFPVLWTQVLMGLRLYRQQQGEGPCGISVDAWGVDFGLLDRSGTLLGNPLHYRDRRTQGICRRAFEVVGEDEIFFTTGTQTMEINTLFQLYRMVLDGDSQLRSAETMLMIPDLFQYFLSGEIAAEYTEATTTQMFSMIRKEWAGEILTRLHVPTRILPSVVYPGTVVGTLRTNILQGSGFSSPVPVIACASHDTASAVAAIPAMDERSVFISSGTWSLIGIEVSQPILTARVRSAGFSNEGGAGGKYLLVKNLTGLWILQQCVLHWNAKDAALDWDDVVAAAEQSEAFRSLIDPDDASFSDAADMPAAIWSYCRSTGQPLPESIGEIARCALESLSFKYRSALEDLKAVVADELRTIRVVGGGVRNALLLQMTADACDRVVVAGPAEASSLGNVMLQAIATGHVRDVHEGRAAIAESEQALTFLPRNSADCSAAYFRFKELEHRKSERQ